MPSPLGKLNWANLFNYKIQPSDMSLFQTYMMAQLQNFLVGERGSGIIFGGQISPVSGFQLQLSATLAVMPDGTLIYIPVTTFTPPASNPSNPRIDRIELAYALTNNSTVLDVNSNSLVLDQLYQASINVNTGTPGVSPVPNSLTSGNISLGLVTIGAGTTTISGANISQIVDAGFTTSPLLLGNQVAGIRFNQTLNAFQTSVNGSTWGLIGAGGGGGAGANWQAVGGAGAIESYEFDDKVYLFSQGQLQEMTVWAKVPKTYLPGNPISLRLGHYSPSNSNNWQFQAVTSLVRQNTDPITSTSNQYTSTNTYYTNTVANLYTQVLYDLSTTNGLINSIGPNPGDLLKVVLTRIAPTSGTDDSADVRMVPATTEVLFS